MTDYSQLLEHLINKKETETIRELQRFFAMTTEFAVEDISRGRTWPNPALQN